ncbi:MAG: putative toxin-antitoxin system toxin component, PIN family [Clostridia bacterium]|jgi:putative PIN family toxin of toxin-antitoxin system|nr:putative toxin-antitoxin system toxin component, PIN family [Clostridia bacterium]
MRSEVKAEVVKVVLDTNVYISAILFGGKPERIISMARSSEIELLISPDILAEVARVLRAKFAWTDEQIRVTLAEITSITTLITPKIALKVIAEDKADNMFLACALAGGAEYVVSGDTRHLQPLKEYQGIRILSPAEFLPIITRFT